MMNIVIKINFYRTNDHKNEKEEFEPTKNIDTNKEALLGRFSRLKIVDESESNDHE